MQLKNQRLKEIKKGFPASQLEFRDLDYSSIGYIIQLFDAGNYALVALIGFPGQW